MQQIRPAIVMILAMTMLTGLVYPLAMTGHRPARLSPPGEWQPDRARRQGHRLRADRPELHRRHVFPRPAVGDDGTRPEGRDKTIPVPYAADNSAGSNLGPTSKALIDRVKARRGKRWPRRTRARRCRSIW